MAGMRHTVFGRGECRRCRDEDRDRTTKRDLRKKLELYIDCFDILSHESAQLFDGLVSIIENGDKKSSDSARKIINKFRSAIEREIPQFELGEIRNSFSKSSVVKNEIIKSIRGQYEKS